MKCGEQEGRKPKNFSLSENMSPLMVSFQLHWVQSYVGHTHLDVSVSTFPERKAHPEVAPSNGLEFQTELKKGKGKGKTQATMYCCSFWFFCFVIFSNMSKQSQAPGTTAGSCVCLHAFSMMMDCTLKPQAGVNASFLKLFSVWSQHCKEWLIQAQLKRQYVSFETVVP